MSHIQANKTASAEGCMLKSCRPCYREIITVTVLKLRLLAHLCEFACSRLVLLVFQCSKTTGTLELCADGVVLLQHQRILSFIT